MLIHTSIRGGLPVLASGEYVPGYAGSTFAGEQAHVECLAIFWPRTECGNFRECDLELPEQDERRIEQELIEAHRERYCNCHE